jgi:hypothetical protein
MVLIWAASGPLWKSALISASDAAAMPYAMLHNSTLDVNRFVGLVDIWGLILAAQVEISFNSGYDLGLTEVEGIDMHVEHHIILVELDPGIWISCCGLSLYRMFEFVTRVPNAVSMVLSTALP